MIVSIETEVAHKIAHKTPLKFDFLISRKLRIKMARIIIIPPIMILLVGCSFNKKKPRMLIIIKRKLYKIACVPASRYLSDSALDM